MHLQTYQTLVSLNRQFYQTFALQFSTTRLRLQPGVQRLLPELQSSARILDLGCGNGELALQLLHRGFSGVYTGLDFSDELLEIARSKVSEVQPYHEASIDFLQADLGAREWSNQLVHATHSHILAFAVLHHLPGAAQRLGFLRELRRLLIDRVTAVPPGQFIHSEWQFLSSERMRRRIQPWETIHLTSEDVEPGDFLLDWRQGGRGLRYVHHFSLDELEGLAAEAGFAILDSYLSDGENGRLGLYQVWVPT